MGYIVQCKGSRGVINGKIAQRRSKYSMSEEHYLHTEVHMSRKIEGASASLQLQACCRAACNHPLLDH